MSTKQTHRFTHVAVAPRTKRIPEAIWELHKAQICELYKQMPLDKVRAVMRLKHYFHATFNQYYTRIHDKWNISKYQSDQHTDGHVSGPISRQVHSSNQSNLKRPRTPDSSAGETGPEKQGLPNKRLNHDVGPFFPGLQMKALPELPDADHMVENEPIFTIMDMSHVSPPEFAPTLGSAVNPLIPSKTPARETDINEQDPGSLTTTCQSSQNKLQEQITTTVSTFDFQNLGTDPEALNVAANVPVRIMNIAESANELRVEDLAGIKLAADYLAVFDQDNKAFDLYWILLGHQLFTSGPDDSFWYLITQCVNTATHYENALLMRRILDQIGERIEGMRCTQSALEFMKHLMMATISSAMGDIKAKETSMLCASCSQFGEWIKQLDDRRFMDISFNASHIDLPICKFLHELDGNALSHWTPLLHWTPSHEYPLREYVRHITTFEMGHNQCIKSCAKWCARSLEDVELLRGVLEGLDEPLSESSDGLSTKEAPSDSLYLYLWSKACNESSQKEKWITEAPQAIGISSSELLYLVLQLIRDGYSRTGTWTAQCRPCLVRQDSTFPGPNAAPQHDSRLPLGCLDCFRRRAYVLESSWECSLAEDVFLLYIKRAQASKQKTKAYYSSGLDQTRMLLNDIEKTLRLRIVGINEKRLQYSKFLTNRQSSTHAKADSLADTRFDTLAPSLCSTDFSSFRRKRNAIDKLVDAFKRERPSRLSLSSTIDNVTDSLRSMDLSTDDT